jgi:hypothetical protein
MTFIGSALVYSGIKGYSMLAVLNNLVTGKPIATGVTVANPVSAPSTDAPTAAPPIGSPNSNVEINPKAIGITQAGAMGWSGNEWLALEKLWTGESNWNPTAQNPSSGAYGIPQALPYTKMPKAAWPASAGGHSDALTQIQWGLSYIRSRYGSPSKAYAEWLSRNPHWY